MSWQAFLIGLLAAYEASVLFAYWKGWLNKRDALLAAVIVGVAVIGAGTFFRRPKELGEEPAEYVPPTIDPGTVKAVEVIRDEVVAVTEEHEAVADMPTETVDEELARLRASRDS